jgi:hypothetical protein
VNKPVVKFLPVFLFFGTQIKIIMKNILITIILLSFPLFAQERDSIEVFLIDNYVTPETPHTFILSFFTSEPAKSKLFIDDKFEYTVSDEFIENHKFELDLTGIQLSNDTVLFFIFTEGEDGIIYKSEVYELNLPFEPDIEARGNFFQLCLFAGTIFALPAPVYVNGFNGNYFGLTKEIPLFSLRGSFNYPLGYFSIEYSHIFNAPFRNFLRAGYKHIIEIPLVEYISPGINGFTNFKGFNGISPEITVGWFRIFETFTVYTRYRYNAKPGSSGNEFREISLGLYSGFFSYYF